ncbi:MAG TPA: DoxX family membrane protein [Roseiflexaceae bacterium]|nr:DoxX family membrane protein [Roseiflexaceae bacterium]
MAAKMVDARGEVTIPDPPIAHLLFSTTRLAWLWAILRIYLGYTWLTSGWGKATNPAWVESGDALKGFWERAVTIPDTGRPVIAFDWYRSFIQFMLDNGWYTWFAKLVAYGEVLIGIALIAGAFVGIAAFFGGFMNWNFIMAGTASTNALLFVIAIILMLAWKVAGWYGVDRYLLPRVGTPWTWGGQKQNTGGSASATA